MGRTPRHTSVVNLGKLTPVHTTSRMSTPHSHPALASTVFSVFASVLLPRFSTDTANLSSCHRAGSLAPDYNWRMGSHGRRFRNSWARLDRAIIHHSAFSAEADALFANRSPSTICRYDKDSGGFIASFVLPDATIERIKRDVLPLELGEYAYQLRAALDGLIWDAITFTQGTEPPANANRVEFPITDGVTRIFKDCGFLKFPFPDQLKTWLESIQLNAAEKPEGDPDRGVPTALSDIHDLARLDRHRRLRIVAVVPTKLQFGVNTGNVLSRIVASERIDCDLLGGQYDFLRFQLDTIDGTPLKRLTLKTDVTLEILLEDIEPFEGIDTGTQLRMLIDAVGHIIARFEKQFS